MKSSAQGAKQSWVAHPAVVDALPLADDLEESGVGGVDDPLSGHGQPPDAVQRGHPALQLVDVVPVDQAAPHGGLRLPAGRVLSRRPLPGSPGGGGGSGGRQLYLEYLRHHGAVVPRRQRHPRDAGGQADEEVARGGGQADRHGGRLEDVRGEALRIISFRGY